MSSRQGGLKGGLKPALYVLLVALVTAVAVHQPVRAAESFKPFKNLKALDGSRQSLADVLGTKATLVVFFFPTCPYCNAAFPEVQKIYDRYKGQGLSMVWINVLPDEEKLIAPWREKHGYTVPVLLGARSVANDYKLRMTPTHFLLDSEGGVISSYAGYAAGDERTLDRDIQRALADSAASTTTDHLTVSATISAWTIAPGRRVTLTADVTPKTGMHLYAPGSQHRAVAISLEPRSPFRLDAPVEYPKPVLYTFTPLNEQVLVYDAPFRLVAQLAIDPARPFATPLQRPASLSLNASLVYQACDDRVCYLPESVPLRWTITLLPSSGP